MSAILGIHYLDGRPVARADLDRMLETVSHRGPDGSQAWRSGSVGLGHRMLHTTPESLTEQLPNYYDGLGVAITSDTRLDNRGELIAALGPAARVSTKSSDSELICAAYRSWGQACMTRLLGDFAFAIWDAATMTLFCARDHFGVKPLYYHFSAGKMFVFASEMKALLSLSEVPCRLNEERVADHLAEVFKDSESTFYRDILRLPPAHTLTVNRHGIVLQRYWALDPTHELRLSSDDEYAEAFREHLTEAVRCRLRSAFPVGSMLSGGLDSSSITCIARDLLIANSGGLSTFSTIFDNVPQCDERKYIKAVLAQNGVRPHLIAADVHGPFQDLSKIHWHEDQAFYAPNFAMVWTIYRTVHEQGVRVLLDGHDGDSTVSHGYKFLDELARARRWRRLSTELRGLAKHYGESWFRLLKLYTWHYGLKPVFKKHKSLVLAERVWNGVARRISKSETGPFHETWEDWIEPGFASKVGMANRYREWQKSLPAAARTERDAHFRTLTSSIQPFALEVHDASAAAFSIEKRYPFWDRRLVEFCLSLPPQQKLRDGWTRMIMRRGMEGTLPAKVQWRGGKMDFTPSVAYGLRHFEQETLNDVILRDPGVLEGFVNIATLRETYRNFIDTDSPAEFTELFNIWKCASLGLWLRDSWPRTAERG